ncbi:hypothetical protein [Sphingobium phenoxybenzoativorans]|uniref:hypothetical protein n=1 Tax=Sphingobium phenoxybenzoativorans TaxID=1592790 RepID=UPI0014960341|nr:hypothetical protein [Sphingobium phenoxybenzoativorans]
MTQMTHKRRIAHLEGDRSPYLALGEVLDRIDAPALDVRKPHPALRKVLDEMRG